MEIGTRGSVRARRRGRAPRGQPRRRCVQWPNRLPVPRAAEPSGGTHNVGDTVTVLLDLGAGTITGGPMNILQVTSLRFDLACKVPPLPAPGCTNEGPVMMYTTGSFTSNCPGITWT